MDDIRPPLICQLDAYVSATTQFVVQADKGAGAWYDYSFLSTEIEGRIAIDGLRVTRAFERHRLVRRITLDTEIS